MKKATVIVYGPQGCGKSLNAEKLRKGFGLDRVIDDWDGRERLPRHGALVLTHDIQAMNGVRNAERYTFEAAMRRAGAA